MTYRDRKAAAHLLAAEDALTASKDHAPSSRPHMAALNLAKTHAIISQAYSALVSIEPPQPRVVAL